MDLIELCEKQPSLQELLSSFNDQNVSDYVVVYLRLLTSGYLQREHGFFQHFIEGGRSVKEFCQQVFGFFFLFTLIKFNEPLGTEKQIVYHSFHPWPVPRLVGKICSVNESLNVICNQISLIQLPFWYWYTVQHYHQLYSVCLYEAAPF